jgi:hypothetical protein
VNAHSGQVTYLSNNGSYNGGENKDLTDSQKTSAEKKIGEFLNKVAGGGMNEVQAEPVEYNYENVYCRYTRIVNGVRYIDNGISISFDGKNGKVRSYSLNMDKKEFEDADKAISQYMAYKIILDYAPVKQIYIKCDGEFVKCFTLSKNSVEADAVTGEIINGDYENDEYAYSDIDNHWSKDAVEKLAEIQIGISGGKFEPECKMTQYELLKFLCGGMLNKYYLDMTEDYYDNWFSDYIYIKNLDEDGVEFITDNGKTALEPNDVGVFNFGTRLVPGTDDDYECIKEPFVLDPKLRDRLGVLGWHIDCSENVFCFGKYSPAGQDFSFEVEASDLEELTDEIKKYYDNYDVSYEAYLWLDEWGHGRNGAPYDMKDVYKDMQACEEAVWELYEIIKEEC